MWRTEAGIFCHDDTTYLGPLIKALDGIPVTVFVSEVPHSDSSVGNWRASVDAAEEFGASVITGQWPEEASHRVAMLEWARKERIEFFLIPDTDEIISAQLLNTLRKIAEVDLADIVYCTMDTYWKSPEYVIRPREGQMPPMMLSPSSVEHQYLRQYHAHRPSCFPESMEHH